MLELFNFLDREGGGGGEGAYFVFQISASD